MRSASATALVLVPLVLCILGLALYPQLILKRTDTSVQRTVAAAKEPGGPGLARQPGPGFARHRGRGSEGRSISVSSGLSGSGADAG